MEVLIPVEIIEKKIFLIRGHKVMMDRDLAELYLHTRPEMYFWKNYRWKNVFERCGEHG